MRKLTPAQRSRIVALVFVAMASLAAADLSAQAAPVVGPSASNAPSRGVVWRVDAGVQRRAQELRRSSGATLDPIAAAGNWWGGAGVIVFAAILWIGGRTTGQQRVARVGLRGAEAIAVASAISGIIKGLAGRARPAIAPGEPWHWEFNHGWSDANFFSMPSGHTTATVAFAVAATLAARQYGRTGAAAFGLALGLSAAWVGCSRIYVDQHWFSDVAVAALLGLATSVALAWTHAHRTTPTYHRVMLGDTGERA